jgi:multidrug resistance efflux pump
MQGPRSLEATREKEAEQQARTAQARRDLSFTKEELARMRQIKKNSFVTNH